LYKSGQGTGGQLLVALLEAAAAAGIGGAGQFALLARWRQLGLGGSTPLAVQLVLLVVVVVVLRGAAVRGLRIASAV